MSDLKPCPFCGGEPVFFIHERQSGSNGIGYGFSIRCNRCGATNPNTRQSVLLSMEDDGSINYIEDGRGKAVAVWNARAENA